TGNHALTDLQAALRFLRTHVPSFGGSRARISIFGQSSAGGLVLLQTVLPSSEGLFAGARHTCANVAGGGVRCWGANERSQTGLAAPGPQRPSVSPSGLPPIAAGAATFASSCALTDEGGVRCWGAGDAGQLGTGVTEDSALPQRVLGLP
ncbi:MAG TPA: carboxylesterase family protein, partial [Polyangiaceae bacterium LLY-WYZ-15_(1-7)]|nr:carboxylesterase family protein [Polyangiaceae bacterium LLY-WYZ-15_(1-7)]